MLEQEPNVDMDVSQMTLEEIDSRIANLIEENPEADADVARLRELLRFLDEDDGKPIVMVNLMHLRDMPVSVNGRTLDATADEALNEYGRFVFSFLIKRGSYPVYRGEAAMDVMEAWGIEGAEEWSSAALVRYRSRRVMMELAADPTFGQTHEGKIAAIAKTIAVPTSTTFSVGDLSLSVVLFILSVALGMQLLINRKAAIMES
jgi:hypothetical protein